MTHTLITRAREAAALLAPLAGVTEREGVERATLDCLAEAGLYGVVGPESITGSEPSPAVYREVAEALAGADGNTWFVWLQHHAVVKMLAGSANADLAQRWLPSLCAGTTQAGVAYSHLRSSELVVSATRVDGGWRLAGTAPWCTGWGLLDVVLVGAATADDEIVFAVVPMSEGDGMAAGPSLDLAAMGGTRTVTLHLDGYVVADADVVLRTPRATWAATDAAAGANVQPSTFGVARAALVELAGRDEATATSLSARLDDVRRRAYGLMDDVPASDALEERLALRAEALLLGVEATSALVTSVGGRAMTGANPAQRWAREALFHLVFAQTRPARVTTLARIAGHSGAMPAEGHG